MAQVWALNQRPDKKIYPLQTARTMEQMRLRDPSQGAARLGQRIQAREGGAPVFRDGRLLTLGAYGLRLRAVSAQARADILEHDSGEGQQREWTALGRRRGAPGAAPLHSGTRRKRSFRADRVLQRHDRGETVKDWGLPRPRSLRVCRFVAVGLLRLAWCGYAKPFLWPVTTNQSSSIAARHSIPSLNMARGKRKRVDCAESTASHGLWWPVQVWQ